MPHELTLPPHVIRRSISELATAFVAPLQIMATALILPLPFVSIVIADLERSRCHWCGGEITAGRTASESWGVWLRQRISSVSVWKVDVPIAIASALIGIIELFAVLLGVLASTTMLLAPALHSGGIDVMIGAWSADSWANAWAMTFLGIIISIAVLSVLICTSLARDAAVTWIGRVDAQQILQELDTVRRNRARLVAGFEGERRRIERDLHDGVQQDLLALAITLSLLQHSMQTLKGTRADSVHQLVARAREQAEHATTVLRDTVHGIYPRELTDYGLEAALQQLIERSPLNITYQVSGNDDHVPVTVASAIYYSIAELLSNVTKHAATGVAKVTIKVRAHGVLATVSDYGVGGVPQLSRSDSTSKLSSGLVGLEERLASLDGTIHFDSPPGKGTTATLFVPFTAEGSEKESIS